MVVLKEMSHLPSMPYGSINAFNQCLPLAVNNNQLISKKFCCKNEESSFYTVKAQFGKKKVRPFQSYESSFSSKLNVSKAAIGISSAKE